MPAEAPRGLAPASGSDKTPARIAGMFDQIAERYDLLNRLLSGGLDRYWRWRALRALALTGGETLLDVCTGTADVAIGAVRRRRGARRAIGVDFAGAMLDHGWRKVQRHALDRRVTLVRGDALALPVGAGTVDAATVAFGIRNVTDPVAAAREMHRALTPGGRLAILEFGLPSAPGLRQVYLWYFRRVLPRVGAALSRHSSAYTYLPDSVGAFPAGGAFAALLESAGFEDVSAVPLALGAVYLYTARKPGADRPAM
ncbi:MAG: bifunctional demethylmenaquinone methyltransferase/2-methoxy-6-polyprenyl-1,4-benzoquinol methylase UbiE [Acidobacteriota bacterium]